MPVVESSLARWAATASDEELDRGPNLDDLGGLDAVLAEAHELAHGPQLPYLLGALARSLAVLPEAQARRLAEQLREGLREPHAGWVLTESLDTVLRGPGLVDLLSPGLGADLMALAKAALAGNVDSDLAYPAVAGLLQLSVAGRFNRFGLLMVLTEITGDEPSDALSRLPLLIGLAHDQFGEAPLLDTLSTLEALESLPLSSRSDARFELAMAALRVALDAGDREEVTRLTRDAAMRLRAVADGEEARLDAQAYATALDAVLVFADLDAGVASAVIDRLQTAASSLSDAVAKRHAWNSRMAQPVWLEARGHTEAAWAHLVSTITTAAGRLDEPSWLDASSVLESVLEVYQAARAICTRGDIAGAGIEMIVAPAVEAAFIRRDGLLHHLRQALEVEPAIAEHPDAARLIQAIDARISARPDDGPDPPGKRVAGRPRLASLAIADPDTDPALLDLLEETIETRVRGYALTGNVLIDRQLDALHATLSRSSAWVAPSSLHFFSLAAQLLRFLQSRFDAQADLLGSRTAYLGLPEPGSKWLEKHVQDDFYEHLLGVFPPGTVQRELIDVASGRTDIVYTPQPGLRFVTEVKRELDNATPDSVERKYLPQAANYTATGPPFGVLLIGDHTDHRSGYSSLEDRVWVAQRSRSPTETPRLIVVATLPIGRPTPSDLKTPRPQPDH